VHPNHRRRAWSRPLVVAVATLALAAACSSSKKAATSSSSSAAPAAGSAPASTAVSGAAAGTPKAGGTLKFGLESDVSTLDEAQGLAQPADKAIALAIYDPLMSFDDKGNVVPYLASAITGSADAKTWTLTLRQGVMFSDGTRLNADAVVAHFKRLQDPATKSYWYTDAAKFTETAADDHTVVFSLAAANVAFPQDLTAAEGYIESPTAVKAEGADFGRKPVGTGPFVLKEYVTGDHALVARNPNYWKKDANGAQLPYLDAIRYVPIADTKARLSALQAGDVDLIQTADSSTIKQALDAGFQVQKVSGSSSTVILFDNKVAPVDDARVRQALAYAINRQAINSVVYGGVRQPSYSAFSTSSPYYEKVGTPTFDLGKAKALLAQYGKPVDLTLECITTPESNSILQLVQQMWQDAGAHVTLKTEEQGQYVADIFGHKPYQAACFRTVQFVDPDDLYNTYYTGNTQNLLSYSNPTVDAALDKGRSDPNTADRVAAYHTLQEQLAKDIPGITLLYDLYGNIYKSSVHGLPTPEANSLGAIKVTTIWMS
jgi:ABC-type transport system substrate-binding protein